MTADNLQRTADSFQKTKITSFRQLVVWQRSMELAEEIYRLSGKFPDTERFGMTSQMRRAAVSVPSNIAEGRQRGTRKDFAQFLRIADGSAAELETQLLLSCKLFNVKDAKRAFSLLSEVQRMLGTIIRKL
ncbi:MAG: four helix bundle protein [Parcubacteria group bacterium]|nr:four helix bundle protein [Parcubacteria group bacterium]